MTERISVLFGWFVTAMLAWSGIAKFSSHPILGLLLIAWSLVFLPLLYRPTWRQYGLSGSVLGRLAVLLGSVVIAGVAVGIQQSMHPAQVSTTPAQHFQPSPTSRKRTTSELSPGCR